MPQRCIRSFVTSYRRRAQRTRTAKTGYHICVTVFEPVEASFDYSLSSSCKRTLTFLACEHISIVSRSVCQERRGARCYEPCVHVLMFINCPRRQRNYFVNHPRGKMMARDAVSIVLSLLSLAQRPGGGFSIAVLYFRAAY